MSLLEGVTESQREAISHIDGPLLVVAGAGSGKTRVVARRVAYLIETGIDPHSILAVTFTNKAAEEMSERIRKMSGHGGALVSTFHSFAARTLRRFAGLLGYRNDYTIYDTDDQAVLIKRLLKQAGYDRSIKPGAVREFISRWKNDGLTQPPETDMDTLANNAAAGIFLDYNNELKSCDAMDFDDLLLNLLILLDNHESARNTLLKRIRYILVDEYQDTNQVQFDIARRLASRHENIMATGDPDQSIYSWRGASLENILKFTEHYPAARVIKMEENFRSRAPILDVAGALIQHNKQRIERGIIATRSGGDAVCIQYTSNEEVEASEIARKIAELKSEGVPLNQVAMLYRVNWLSRIYERTLQAAKIPYRLIQGTAFFKRKEVRDIVAYMRLAANPNDEVSAARIVNNPPRGISPALQSRIQEARAVRGGNYLQAVEGVMHDPRTTPARRKALGAFLGVMKPLCNTCRQGPAALIRAINKTSGLAERYRQDENAQDRLDNMEELLNGAAAYEARTGEEASLTGYLEEIALASDDEALDRNEPAVSLMTLHAAKGLEFDVVFMVGLETGILPHSNSMYNEADIEEERRLTYVGITRAREKLFLSSARSRFIHGSRSRQMQSQFLNEIPDNLLYNPDKLQEEDLWTEDDAEKKPEPAYSPPKASGKLQVGDVIHHSHFGVGTVIKLIGTGDKAKATIDFDTEGQMQIRLAYAQIRKIGRR